MAPEFRTRALVSGEIPDANPFTAVVWVEEPIGEFHNRSMNFNNDIGWH
jgi:hypothetical protein